VDSVIEAVEVEVVVVDVASVIEVAGVEVVEAVVLHEEDEVEVQRVEPRP
jgi:hypothetical protein